MSPLPPPLVPGAVRPAVGTAGIGIDSLVIHPVASLPVSPENGQIVTLLSDGVTYQFTNGNWNPIGTPATGGFLTKAQADTYYRQKSTFKFVQTPPALVWTIVHNLASMPVVVVQDSAGTTVEGAVKYIDTNTLTVTFAHPFGGTAYLA